MTQQFEYSAFEDPMIEMGRDALCRLEDAIKAERLTDEDVFAVTDILAEPQGLVGSLEYQTTYRVQALPDIDPRILRREVQPPEYLLGIFGAFSIALAQHINEMEPKRQMPYFAPSREQLDNHIRGLWVLHGRSDDAVVDLVEPVELIVDTAGSIRPTALELAGDGMNLSIDFVRRKRVCQIRYRDL